ncbi:chloride channel voltage gated [Lucifera butyrica]|uniref:Chloride channel voltage gated n=2 Tax=Lucifera butyrica TaxID=1351585 RepID=A0A498RC60_9FIRM|nr:chloride channel voltage gated [Lucifera butyrica]
MTLMEIRKVHHALLHWRNFRLKLFAEGIITGLIGGLTVVLFRFALEAAEVLRTSLYQQLNKGNMALIAGWFILLAGIACLLGRIVKFEPMCSGSGIPQTKGVLLGLIKMDCLKVLAAKFIGGVLAIGAGMSLGREGPSIQIGAVIGQGFSRFLGRDSMEERYLLTSGASAGLAAAFNAPLAGVIFSLEELHKNFSPAVLMPAVAASLTADFMVRYFSGREPIWNFSGVPVLPAHYYVYLLILGVITGLFGAVFNSLLLKTLDIYSRQQVLPAGGKALLPLIAGGIAGFILPEILGGGNTLVGVISRGQFDLSMLLILLAVKFLYTMLSYGSGVPGGIFLPLLVIGALTGEAFSRILVIAGVKPDYHTTFIILAMAAYFTAIVKAPVTGSVLITEMTGSFRHLPELITICMIAYVTADFVKAEPIYESLLERMLQRGLPAVTKTAPPRTVMEIVVCLGSKLDGRIIKEIDWPPHCLLVCVRRGEREIVPKGDTELVAGDYLFVSANEDCAVDIKTLAEDCR